VERSQTAIAPAGTRTSLLNILGFIHGLLFRDGDRVPTRPNRPSPPLRPLYFIAAAESNGRSRNGTKGEF
jgi:hypothetical protein